MDVYKDWFYIIYYWDRFIRFGLEKNIMKAALPILLIFLMISCGDYEYVQFETAQPSGVKASNAFSKKVRGTYIHCTYPEDKLVIADRLILEVNTHLYKVHRDSIELDSAFAVKVNNDRDLIQALNNEGYKATMHQDTIMLMKTITDTVFQISENEILKKFKKSYFLNRQLNDKYWRVLKLNLHKDTLLIGEIYPSDTLLRFDFAVKAEEDSTSNVSKTGTYTLNPTKKEFKQLVKTNAFEKCNCYIKTK